MGTPQSNFKVIRQVMTPRSIGVNENSYIVGYEGESYGENICAGDRLYINPDVHCDAGKFVLFYMNGDDQPLIYRLRSALDPRMFPVDKNSGAIPIVHVESNKGKVGTISPYSITACHAIVHIERTQKLERPPRWADLKPSEDYVLDCERGNEYAVAWLHYLTSVEGIGYDYWLSDLIGQMIDCGDEESRRGLRIGCMSLLGSLLNSCVAGGAIQPNFVAQQVKQRRDRYRTQLKELEEARQSVRSERARKAARARWAKHRKVA